MFYTRNIAISDAVYEAITSITKKKTYLVPNCIDFNRLQPDFEYRFRNKDGNSPYKILLFAYSPYVKGLDVAYKACEILYNENINVELDVVSQAQSDQHILETYNPFPSWFKILRPSNNVSDYYNQTDVFLSASRSEGFSNSLLEAIYCGCPAVFSNIPGTKWANDFDYTFEYEVESPESLAQAIQLCIANTISKNLILVNQQKAKNQYSMDSWAKYIYMVLSDFHR